MLITAVVPTLNEEEYLENCLQSLLDQTLPPDEVLVVDSDSRDNTRQIAESYNCVVIDSPRGKLNARHIGFQQATGDIVFGCDADTLYPPNWIQDLAAPIENGEAVATMGYAICPGPIEGPMRTVLNSIMDTRSHGHHMPGQANAVLKDAYFQSGGLDLDTHQGASASRDGKIGSLATMMEEETDFPQRLAQIGNVKRVETACETIPRGFEGKTKIGAPVKDYFTKTALLSIATSAIGLVATNNSAVGHTMVGAGIGFAAGELGARLMGTDTVEEAYQHSTGQVELANTPLEFLKHLDTDAHIHHDIIGLGFLGAGALLRSPVTLGIGAGLLGHHVATEGASFLGTIAKKRHKGKEVKIPIDQNKGVFEIVEI